MTVPVDWNRKRTKALIIQYHEHECLWNFKHPDYRDKHLKQSALNLICANMGKVIRGITVKDIKSKLHGIRSQYLKALRRTEDDKQPRLWSLKLLEFLRPLTAHSEIGHSGIKQKNTPITHNVPDESSSSESSSSEEAQKPTTNKRNVIREFNRELKELQNTIAHSSERRYHWIGEQMVSTLNEMKNDEVIEETIETIQRIIMRFKRKDRMLSASNATDNANILESL